MQTSVAGEIASRLELFEKSFAFCRQGGFSFARFLALVPDRLRLALGDEGHRVRIPVTVAPAVVDELARRLPDWPVTARPSSVDGPPTLRRVVRLAQLDSGINPIGLLWWLREHADGLVSLFASAYRRGFSEVGRGEGGAETAYLVHLMTVELARRQVAARLGERIEAQAILTSIVDAAIEGALNSRDVDDHQLSTRLAYQLAATRSALAFGADPDQVASRPANAYRTIPRAVQLARRVIQPPLEVIPLDRVASTVSKRLLVEAPLRTALLKDLLLELVRDAALVAALQAYRPHKGGLAEVLAPALSAPNQLVQHVFNHRRRMQLIDGLKSGRAEAPKPVEALLRLLDGAPAVEQGDPAPLGVHGHVEERALLAARGAICLVLETHAEALKRDVNALVEWLEPSESRVAYLEGRCYRLGLDGRPLFQLPERRRDAFVFVDASELVRRTAERRPAALGDLVSRYLMGPLLERYKTIRAADQASFRLVHLGPDQAGFAGDIGVAIEFAESARLVIFELQAHLGQPVADVLGGSSRAVGEADEEIAEVEARIQAVDLALHRTPKEDDSVQLLHDSRLLLEKRLAVLTEARRRLAGLSQAEDVDVGIYIAYGATAVAVPIPSGVVDADAVWFSPHIMEARRGCARVPWVKDDRSARIALGRKARGEPAAVLPFAVSLRARDERTAIYNAGCGLSEGALKAYLHARSAVLTFLELTIELRELHEAHRRKYVFDRDPERFVVGLGRMDHEIVQVFRCVGRHGSSEIWELLASDNPFVDVLVDFVPGAREVTE